jgi:hypothetical protein
MGPLSAIAGVLVFQYEYEIIQGERTRVEDRCWAASKYARCYGGFANVCYDEGRFLCTFGFSGFVAKYLGIGTRVRTRVRIARHAHSEQYSYVVEASMTR